MKPNKEESGGKHVKLRLAVFIIALIIAVGAFTVGIVSINSRDDGWYQLQANPAEDGVNYAAGVHAYYYFEGSSNEIRQKTRLVTQAYSEALEWIVRQLDPVTAYDGYVNLAVLNASPGTYMEVSPEVYAALQTALAYTDEGKGYSVFSGDVYRMWEELCYLSSPGEADPALNADTAQRIAAAASALNAENAFALDFKAGNQVRLTVGDAYKRAVSDLELPPSAPLDLGFLRDAFTLEYVAKKMLDQGYDQGLLTTDSGLMYTFSGSGEANLDLLGFVDGASKELETIPFNGGTAVSLRKVFAETEEEQGYYTVTSGGKTLFRSLRYDARTGENPDEALSVYAVKENASPADLAALSYASLLRALGDGGKPAGITLYATYKDAPQKVVKE